MDSLANYGSDGENSNNSEDTKIPDDENMKKRVSSYQVTDANYDPVQMDMSEESNNNHSSGDSDIEGNNSPAGVSDQTTGISKSSCSRNSASRESPSDQRRTNDTHGSHNRSGDSKRREGGVTSDSSSNKSSERSSRHSDSRCRRPSDDDRKRSNSDRNSDRRDSKRSREDDRRSRDNDRQKDRNSLKDDKSYYHRYDRRSERRRDRDHRRSRSDRTKDSHRDDKSSHQKEKEHPRSRSRSKSKDRVVPAFKPMSYREEKGRNKLAQLEKLGIELKTPEGTINSQALLCEQNYYNPLTTAAHGKYAEQIQKRKLLWANKPKQDDGKNTNQVGSNTWVGTTFTHDQDGKMSAKFKRLMGIKEDTPSNPPTVGQKPDILKKQEEMFNNMEQQYEVARATTHTQRGVGLGYASGGYQFPR